MGALHTVKSTAPPISSVLGKRPGYGDEESDESKQQKVNSAGAKSGVFVPKKEQAARRNACVLGCGNQ